MNLTPDSAFSLIRLGFGFGLVAWGFACGVILPSTVLSVVGWMICRRWRHK